jgi:hypothetical protein
MKSSSHFSKILSPAAGSMKQPKQEASHSPKVSSSPDGSTKADFKKLASSCNQYQIKIKQINEI